MNDLPDRVLGALKGVQKHGSYHQARCQAHEDDKVSLSVTTGKDGPYPVEVKKKIINISFRTDKKGVI